MANLEGKKCLIAYFSRKGSNYVSGKIMNLPIGNTEVVANIIQQEIGGDLFQIESAKPYPKDYQETTEVAQVEKRSNVRPELTNKLENMDDYDVIFIGYPNWWNTMPMPVYSFLEQYDFSGKVIIPFCTHEGSGLGSSERDIKNISPKAIVKKGIAIHGTKVKNSRNEIISWLSNI